MRGELLISLGASGLPEVERLVKDAVLAAHTHDAQRWASEALRYWELHSGNMPEASRWPSGWPFGQPGFPPKAPRDGDERVERVSVFRLSTGGKLALAGALTLFVSWAATTIAFAGTESEHAPAAAIPVAGPMIVFANYREAPGFGSLPNFSNLVKPLMVVSAVVQSAGFLILAVGVPVQLSRENKQQRAFEGNDAALRRHAERRLSLEPWAPPGSVGSGLRLRF